MEEACNKLIQVGFLTEETEITAEKISLMMIQLATAAVPGNVNETVLTLKALALLVANMSENEQINRISEGVIELVTGEAVSLAAGNAIKNEMWKPLEELTVLKDDLIEWRNSGGTIGNLEDIKDELREEIQLAVRKISAAAAEQAKASTVALDDATKEIRSMIEELRNGARENKEAVETQGEEGTGQEAEEAMVAPMLWWNKGKGTQAMGRTEGGGSTGQTSKSSKALTYADMIKAGRTLTQKQALEKAADDACKVMLIMAEKGQKQGLEGMSPEVLIEKADAALEMMKQGGLEIHTGFSIRGAKVLPGGNVVYTVNTPAAGRWLREHREEFMRGFGGMSKIADAVMAVLVENVPASFCLTEKSVRGLEEKNSLPEGSINGSRWMKPVMNRKAGQKTAHLLLNFNVAQSANLALRRGIFVMGSRCHTRKLISEPPRCFKCQKMWARLEHLAINCKNKLVCATCGKEHHSNRCELLNGDPVHHYCVNCGMYGHASSDKMCPAFRKLTVEMNRKNPGGLFKYYVIEGDEETMELLHADAAEIVRERGQEGLTEEGLFEAGHRPKRYNYGRRNEEEAAAHQYMSSHESIARIRAKAIGERTDEEWHIMEEDVRNQAAEREERQRRWNRGEEATGRTRAQKSGALREEIGGGASAPQALTAGEHRVESHAEAGEQRAEDSGWGDLDDMYVYPRAKSDNGEGHREGEGGGGRLTAAPLGSQDNLKRKNRP